MNTQSSTISNQSQVQVKNYLPKLGRQAIIQEIKLGLTSKNKVISSKYFYDATGSKLFEKITKLPEYYPTRTEMALIKQLASSINGNFDYQDIVEIGSGDASKITILLNHLSDHQSIIYRPVDVSQSALEESAQDLINLFPGLKVHGMVADFMKQLNLLPEGNKRLICFFGSTIGNFNREQGQYLINQISQVLRPGDKLLLGLDRVKDSQVLESAYNDSQTITAQFNRNILMVINKLAGTNFDSTAFEHIAFFNEQEARIEMHLKAKQDMIITSPFWNEVIPIRSGETIHTENSHKFTDEHIAQLAKSSGLVTETILTDPNQWFSLVQFSKPSQVSYATN